MLLLLSLGCSFDEHLNSADIHGVVTIPRAAATRPVTDLATGETSEIVDTRNIGPVIIGAYPSVVQSAEYGHPHPEVGPVIDPSLPPDTYPYGGGTAGRFDYACYQHLVCQVVTGRFTDYDDLLDWYSDVIHDPVVDDDGNMVQSGDYMRQSCYELFEITADYEMAWISGDDGLDFTENADGDFEADFSLWHTNYKQGMSLWGWVDTPSQTDGSFQFSTCDPTLGQQNNEYTNDYDYGTGRWTLLNSPGEFIGSGDFVTDVDAAPVLDWEDADALREADPTVELNISYLVGSELED